MSIRTASHAGSWYTDDGELALSRTSEHRALTDLARESSPGKEIDDALGRWLGEVHPEGIPSADQVVHPESSNSAEASSSRVTIPVPGCRAIIGPHAGYSYSGPAAAWAYKCIDTKDM